MRQIIAVILLVGVTVVSIRAQNAPPPPPPPPPAARDVPLAEWKTFKSEAGKFSVLMPTKPKEDQQTNGSVKITVFHSFMSQYDFKVNFVELPNAAPDVKTLWERIRASITTRKEMKLVGEKQFEIEGRPALELTGQSEFALMQIRIVTAGNFIFQLTALSLNKQAETPEARAFLDSFKFLNAPEDNKPKQNN